jgi:hypothetical protein
MAETDTSKLIYTPSEWGQRYHRTRADEIFGAGAAGPGKALCLTTWIPTPLGMKRLKDVHPGDQVYAPDGSLVHVIAETEVFHNRPCYKLYANNNVIIADAAHEWVAESGRKVETKDLGYGMNPYDLLLTRTSPVEYGFKEKVLDPYVYGLMLFGGIFDDPAVVSGSENHILIALTKHLKYNKRCGYARVAHNLFELSDKEYARELRLLVRNKALRVAKAYKYSSILDRSEFIRGVMDSVPGFSMPYVKIGHPVLSDISEILASIGIVTKIRQSKRSPDCETILCYQWRHRIKPMKYEPGRGRISIRSYGQCPSVPVKCIQVEGGQFLVTKGYVPTHNSMVLLHDPLQQIMIEHLRCANDERLIPESWDTEAPGLRQLIMENPLQWGHSTAWVLQMMREMPNHEENIERAKRAFPVVDEGVQWNEKKSTFSFSSGLKYQFGHCKDKDDHQKYLSKQYTWVGFDELTRFNKTQYDFIRSRVRSADPVLRYFLRCCAMSNPQLAGGKGNDITVDDPLWVKKYFVDPWPDGNKLLQRTMTRRDGTKATATRIYLPATLYDNPDAEFVRQYEARLLGMPKHIRDCYLYGKWDGIVGSHFNNVWNPSIHICEPFKIPSSWPIFRAQDWGFSTSGNVGYYALSPDNKLYKWFEITFIEKSAGYVAKELIRPFEEKNRLWSGRGSKLNQIGGGPSDRQIWEERGSSAKNKYMEMHDEGVDWVKADQKSREQNCATFKERLLAHNGMTEPPGIVFFRNCRKSIETIPSLETDPYNLEQTKKAKNDHWYDETTYACRFALQSDLNAVNHREDPDEFDEPLERYY